MHNLNFKIKNMTKATGNEVTQNPSSQCEHSIETQEMNDH